jgi:hypothetical protein
MTPAAHALLVRLDLRQIPNWHSQLAIYGHADVSFTANVGKGKQVEADLPLIVLNKTATTIVAWGKTTNAVAITRARSKTPWLDNVLSDLTTLKGYQRTRICARLHKANVSLDGLKKYPISVYMHPMLQHYAMWLTGPQYADFCQALKLKPESCSVSRRERPAPPSVARVPDARDAKVVADISLHTALSMLSVRAANILNIMGVKDVATFQSLTPEELLKYRNCGRKTVAEVAAVQETLRVKATQERPPPPPSATLTYESAPATVFDAIRTTLDVRSNHVLENMAVTTLASFMRLEHMELMRHRNCGRKTTSTILALQKGITGFARSQADRDGAFHPEKLLAAPCLTGIPRQTSLGHPEGVSPDPQAPAPWLNAWVHTLAGSERYARAFMLRMGMLGSKPMILEDVAREVGGVTRERARQMQVKVAQKAVTTYQQQRLRPLVEQAASVVNQRGGMLRVDELTQTVLRKGDGGDKLAHATALIIFFSGLQVWKDAGLRPVENGVVRALSCTAPLPPPVKTTHAHRRIIRTEEHIFDPNDLTI